MICTRHWGFFVKEQISYTWFLLLPLCMSSATFLDIKCSLSYKNSSSVLAPNAFHAFCREYHSMSLYHLAPSCLGIHIFALFTSVRDTAHRTQVLLPAPELAHSGGNTLTQTDADKLPEETQCQLISLREGVERAIYW